MESSNHRHNTGRLGKRNAESKNSSKNVHLEILCCYSYCDYNYLSSIQESRYFLYINYIFGCIYFNLAYYVNLELLEAL